MTSVSQQNLKQENIEHNNKENKLHIKKQTKSPI